MEQEATFLVEHYLPGKRLDELESFARRIATAERVRVLQTTVVPEDESVLCVIAAPSKHAVRAAYIRAGLHFDRISAAIARAHTRKGDIDAL
jgi:hypothetical protein